MFDGESKAKNMQFIKSLAKKQFKNQKSFKKKEDDILPQEEQENLDQFMQRTLYNQDLVIYSRVMIKKKKLYSDQISQLQPTQLSDLYREFKNFNSSYEARKNFYLKKNKILDQVDNIFHSSILEKKGTFYDNFKDYSCKNPKESEVIIGSRDMLSQNPDLFIYEKFDEDFSQKVCFVGERHKKQRIASLNDFKEISGRLKNKSMEKLNFITPFQNNLNEKLTRKREIQGKIDDLKHKNLNLNLDALIKTENLSNQLIGKDEGECNLDLSSKFLLEKVGKISSFTTANSTKSNLRNEKNDNINGAEKKQLLTVNGKMDFNSIYGINRSHNDKSLHYLVFDRNKTSLSANVNSLGSPNSLKNGYIVSKENLTGKNNSKEKKERERKDVNLDATDKEQLLKCVLEKLPNSQKIDIYNKKKKEADEARKSEEKAEIFLSPKKLTKNKTNEENNEETISPISRLNDSFYLNKILNNETNKNNTNTSNQMNYNHNINNILADKLKNKKKDKQIKKNYKNEGNANKDNINNSKIYLLNPFNIHKREFDNNDLNLDRERRHNFELSHNQNIPLMHDQITKSNEKENRISSVMRKNKIDKNSDPYESYFKNTTREFSDINNNDNNINTNQLNSLKNQFIKIESVFNNNNSKQQQNTKTEFDNLNDGNLNKNKLDNKENSKLNSFVARELANERKRQNVSLNAFFSNNDCNSHILGSMYQANKNKQKENLIFVANYDHKFEKNILNEQNNQEIQIRLNSNKSRNSNYNHNNNTDTESYKFSNHSSFELENNIIEVRSKYGREIEINVGAGKGAKLDFDKKVFNDAANGNNNNIGCRSNEDFKKSKKINFSEIKNAKINQTLNESVFKEVNKKIINLNYPIPEESVNELNENNKSLKNNFNKSSMNPYLSEIQTQKNFIGKKLNIRNKSVFTPSALTINNQIGSEQNTHYFSIKNNYSNYDSNANNFNNKNNDEGINNKGKLFVTNYNSNSTNYIDPIKSNHENVSTKSSNIVIYTNANINNNPNITSVPKNISDLTNQDDIKGESLGLNDTIGILPSAQNTSNSKILKSKSRIFTNRESPFKNTKIKKIFCADESQKNNLIRDYAAKETELLNINNIITKNAAGTAKNKVVLEFQYPPGSSRNRSRKEQHEISLNFISNSNYNNPIIVNSIFNNNTGSYNINNNNINIPNGKVNKKMINRSCTTREPLNCEVIVGNININNNDKINDNSKISNNSSVKSRNNSKTNRISRSNSLRNNNSASAKKDWNFSMNSINLKDTPQYFLNRNIMEEYEKIKSHTRKSSENQIIYSELKYKLDILHENKSNFTNLLNEEIIKGKVVDNRSFILPKI